MSNSDDKTPKTNGLATDPLRRLASFKAPRDLSLGAGKANKKVFTPNLNVTRNKNKGQTTTNINQRNEDKARRERKFDKNKFVKNGPNIVKSSGVFSEGLGAIEHHSSRVSYGSRESNTSATLQKPTIRVKDVIKIDKELEDQRIKSVVGDNEQESFDFKKVLEKDAPVKLPMGDEGWFFNKNKAVKFNKEVVVKQEPLGDELDGAILATDSKPLVDVKEEVYEDTDVVNLLRTDKPTLILLQLPDTLPGRGGSVDDEAPRRKTTNTAEPSTSNAEVTEEKQVDNRCRLSDLEEGRIGKLLIHRSGRVMLALGDTMFEVCSGTKSAFHQEVVSVATNDSSRSANLVSLGPLQHKLDIVPDWESMFCDMPI